MVEDEELERIKLRKLKEMLKHEALERKTTFPQEQKKLAFNKPVEVTDATLMEAVQNNALVVVDCWAPWCFVWNARKTALLTQ